MTPPPGGLPPTPSGGRAAPGPSDHEELILFLERDQLVADTSRPLDRARLGPGAHAALWALRGFVLVLSAMVVYAFVHQLG